RAASTRCEKAGAASVRAHHPSAIRAQQDSPGRRRNEGRHSAAVLSLPALFHAPPEGPFCLSSSYVLVPTSRYIYSPQKKQRASAGTHSFYSAPRRAQRLQVANHCFFPSLQTRDVLEALRQRRIAFVRCHQKGSRFVGVHVAAHHLALPSVP